MLYQARINMASIKTPHIVLIPFLSPSLHTECTLRLAPGRKCCVGEGGGGGGGQLAGKTGDGQEFEQEQGERWVLWRKGVGREEGGRGLGGYGGAEFIHKCQ